LIEIYLATSNKEKIKEVDKIIEKLNIKQKVKLCSIFDEIKSEFVYVDENGETYTENSVIKAWRYGKIINKPVVSDDSGLNIVALDGFPGVHSSRFMFNSPYRVRMKTILSMMQNIEDRKAYFACAATYFDIENNILISLEERVYGTIAYDIRGSNGFGYDPIFIPKGYNQTFGELPTEIKNEISHRGKAFNRLFTHLISSSLI